MTHFTRTLAAGLLFGGLWVGMPTQKAAAAGEDQAVLRADAEFTHAVAQNDVTALPALLDADFTWTDSGGTAIPREQVLQVAPLPAIADSSEAKQTERSYGDVAIVQAHNGKLNVVRIWAKRPEGWRLLVYQAVDLMDTAPTITPGTGNTCENPCKTIPYQPKNRNEKDALAAFMTLQTATVAHDSAHWGNYVADEFAAASSNSNQLLDKRGRMADLERSKMAGYAPMPVTSMHIYDFGNAEVFVSDHQPLHGRPMHITRLWIKRGGKWLEAASYQTRIQSAAPQS